MLIGVAAVSMCAWAGDFVPGGPCTRGRVTMNGKTIVTDWGTLLRMGCWGLDMARSVPPLEDFKTIKQCGVNGVHVYFEKYDASYSVVGYNAERMDTIVEYCRQESLYVVMTIGSSIVGNWSEAMMKDVNACKAIWEFYAPRYADQTHVIYEIKNEPGWAEVNIARACYPVMRAAAPETHILQGSYSNVAGGPGRILGPINSLEGVIDWSNASIAFHGYVAGGDFQENVIKIVNDSGYCMTMTECWANSGLEEHYEHAQISYAPMAGCFTPMAQRKCEQMKKCSLSYAPDFGDWPQHHIDYPTLTKWPSWNTCVGSATANTHRLVFGAVAQGNVATVYDISGRTLWRQRGNGTYPAATRPGANSRVLVVDYGGR